MKKNLVILGFILLISIILISCDNSVLDYHLWSTKGRVLSISDDGKSCTVELIEDAYDSTLVKGDLVTVSYYTQDIKEKLPKFEVNDVLRIYFESGCYKNNQYEKSLQVTTIEVLGELDSE